MGTAPAVVSMNANGFNKVVTDSFCTVVSTTFLLAFLGGSDWTSFCFFFVVFGSFVLVLVGSEVIRAVGRSSEGWGGDDEMAKKVEGGGGRRGSGSSESSGIVTPRFLLRVTGGGENRCSAA